MAHASFDTRLEAVGFDSLFDGLSAREIAALEKRDAYHEFWERSDQRPPPGHWIYWQLCGGRGGGKTDPASTWVNSRAEAGKGPIRLIAGTASDVRTAMVEGPSGILANSRSGFVPRWEPSIGDAGLLTWPNGVQGLCFGSEAPSRLRGKAGQTDWYDDVSNWSPSKAKATFAMAARGLREGDGRAVITYNPDEQDLVVFLMESNTLKTVRTHSITDQNLENLGLNHLDLLAAQAGTEEEQMERFGRRVEKSDRSPFHGLQFDTLPIRVMLVDGDSLVEVCIVIDPSDGARSTSDECGLLAMGRDAGGHVFVLDDRSGVIEPEVWGARAITMAEDWGADVFVGETNRGEVSIRSTLNAAYLKERAETGKAGLGAMLPIVGVCAMAGKTLRAGPVRTLYTSGRMHHVPKLAALEAQMRAWDPSGPKRPRQDDRIDALVHGATYLARLNDVSRKRSPRGAFRIPGIM